MYSHYFARLLRLAHKDYFEAILSDIIVMLNFFKKKVEKRNFRAYCFLYWSFSADFSLHGPRMVHQISKTGNILGFTRRGFKCNVGKSHF